MTVDLGGPGFERLLANLASNRFLPSPPEELKFCGDGDYRAIGAEFLGNFVRIGRLSPGDRVLDIGCGIGRMAVPLTQFLSGDATYRGVDVVRDGVDWCTRAITSKYPRFEFSHLDCQHDLYNPDGVGRTASSSLPFPDGSFDFVFLVSVLTHLDASELARYAAEIARVLAPGGRCFATAFLMNPPSKSALASGAGKLAFDPSEPGPEFHADKAAPMAAVAYDEDFFLEKFLRHGLHRSNPASYGHWSGRKLDSFQDICVFERSVP